MRDKIENILSKGRVKLLISCRSQISTNTQFKRLAFFTENLCDLQSENFRLTEEERMKIATKYLPEDVIKDLQERIDLIQKDEFPLLCRLYAGKRLGSVQYFFENPISMIKREF